MGMMKDKKKGMEMKNKVKKKMKRRTKEQILIDRHSEKKAALKKEFQKQKEFLSHNLLEN